MAAFDNDLMENFPIKMAVLGAMRNLMRTTPLDKLSVKRICREANVSHSTFYRNFQDKHAVAQWYLEYAYAMGVNRIGRSFNWQEGYYITTATIAEQSEFFQMASESRDYNSVRNFAYRNRRNVLQETVTEFCKTPIDNLLNFQIDFTVAMELWVFPRWNTGMYQFSLIEISEMLASLVPRDLFELLNSPQIPISVYDNLPYPPSFM